MRRNIHYKPSKAASIFGGIVGCAMGIFGLFAIPDMGALIGFKAIWCLMAFGMGIYYFLMAAGVVNTMAAMRSPTRWKTAQRAASLTLRRGSRNCRPFTTAGLLRKRSISKSAGRSLTSYKRKERGQWEKF